MRGLMSMGAWLWRNNSTPVSVLWFGVFASLVTSLSLNSLFLERLLSRIPDQTGLIVTLVALLLLLNALLFWLASWPRIIKPFFLFCVLCGASASYFMHNYGILVDKDMLQNVIETDVAEAKGLLTLGMLLHMGGLMLVPLWLCWRFPIERPALGRHLKQWLIAGLILVLSLGSIAATSYSSLVPFFRNFRDIKQLALPLAPLSSAIGVTAKLIDSRFPTPLAPLGQDAKLPTRPASDKPRLLVLVLGETARADHFSLNGYERQTNPRLSQLPVVSFQNVSSCGTATAHSVPCMFSHLTRDNYREKVAKNTENVLDISQRAGVQVHWLDNNSGCKGVCARISHEDLYDESNPLCQAGHCQDAVLVPAVKRYLEQRSASSQDTLLVLHQLGSHGPEYAKRSLAELKQFQPECQDKQLQLCDRASIVNAYDNSLLATDQLLADLIDYLGNQTSYASSLLYISDHGESLGENGVYLHGMPYMMAPTAQTQVPMIWWMSPEYRQQQRLNPECLQVNRQRPLSHDNLFHTVLGAFDVQTQVYQASEDALKSCRVPHV